MNNKIFIKDWLLMKPYTRQESSDIYYLSLANQIKKELVSESKEFKLSEIFQNADEVITHLSCFLAAYLEDMVSETRIWETFLKVYKQKYYKTLPVVTVRDAYYEGEVNEEDLNFLIWYFVNSFQDVFIFAHNEKWIIKASSSLAALLQKAWEVAPENERLKTYFQLGTKIEPFFEVRKLIEKLYLQSYFFFPDVRLSFMKELQGIAAKEKEDQATMLIWNQQTYTYHNYASRLMGMYGNEWVAAYLGEDHALYADVKAMSRKISAAFLFKGAAENTLQFEHIASGIMYDVEKESLHEAVFNIDEAHYIDLVHWQGKYWMSGLTYKLNFNEQSMEEERDNTTKANLVNALLDPEWNKPGLEAELKVFKSLNNGHAIAFMDKEGIIAFLEKFKESVATNRSIIDSAAAINRLDHVMKSFRNDVNLMEGVVTMYFDVEVGLEFAFNVQEAFLNPANPYFDASKSGIVLLEMVTNESISKQLVEFYLRTNSEVVASFTDEIKETWIYNMDFLLRFWKARTYYLKAI